MRNLTANIFGVCILSFWLVYLVSDVNDVDAAIIHLKAQIFGAL